MDRTMYAEPVVRKRPYSFWEDVLFNNKYVFLALIISVSFIIYGIKNYGFLENITAVDSFTNEQIRFISTLLLIIITSIPSAGLVGSISIFFSGKIKSISIITIPVYFTIGFAIGIFKLFRDLIRLPFSIIIWISTKLSKKQYEKHMVIERYEDYL